MLTGSSALAAAAAALSIVGCGRKKAAHDERPRTGGTLRTGTTLPIASGLDPQIETGTGLEIFPRIYGYLFHVDARDDSVTNDQALSVEHPDPTTCIVKLRPDTRFHDLAPVYARSVSADDVVESITRYRDNPLVTAKTWHTTVLDNAEAIDASTVRVTTRRPYVYTTAELGNISAGAILPRELTESKADLAALSIGSGPFRLDAVVPSERARIVRNPGYYRAPLPYLDAMEWTIFSDDDAKLAAFKAASIDVMPNRDGAEARSLQASSDEIEVSLEPSLASVALGLRVDRAPFNDPRTRGAIDLAIDRAALIRDVAFGNGDVLGAVNPHLAGGFWSLSEAEVLEGHSGTVAIDERRQGARALLQAAGAAGASFALEVANIPQMIDVATVIRQQLLTLGLDVVLRELDLLQWFTNFRRGQFEATVIGHLPYESPDTPTRFYHSGGPDGTTNMFGFADGTIDGLVERSWGEYDRAARQQTLLDAQRLMLKARSMIQIFTSTGYSTAWKRVRNRHPDLIGSAAQFNYEQWLASP